MSEVFLLSVNKKIQLLEGGRVHENPLTDHQRDSIKAPCSKSFHLSGKQANNVSEVGYIQ